jgi:prepilin-type N-terminal cleavage/methylation domain-containing protein
VKSVAKKQKMKKAFTLIELVVAVALLAMVFLFAGTIFKVSINAYRTSVANAEIMQKLRAITDQMNADFKGVLWNPEMRIHFDESNNIRSDSIIFFANGDFQSTGQHGSSDKTVVGNVACILYGLADTSASEPKEKILVRRQTIITADSDVDPCDLDPPDHLPGEYSNTKSLAELIAEKFDANDIILSGSLDPEVDADFDKLSVMYMAKGVDDFTIQYVGTEIPPDLSKKFNEWRPKNSEVIGWPTNLYPIAFKFTFTLYDSKGVIKEGRTFTHIIYLGE